MARHDPDICCLYKANPENKLAQNFSVYIIIFYSVKKKILKVLKYLSFIPLFFLVYFLFAVSFAKLTCNSDFSPCTSDAIEVYIKTNGVHTDLVVPVKNEIFDWSSYVDPSKTQLQKANYRYAAFGWGDKGFYLETPTWSELKASTAFKALFFLSTTAMHVTFYDSLPENDRCKRICISKESYQKMTEYIKSSFKIENGRSVYIPNAHYGTNDIFYDANGSYSMFYTCNTWANAGLKSANMKAAYWTLFDKGIFEKY